jgi:hypothetical protein
VQTVVPIVVLFSSRCRPFIFFIQLFIIPHRTYFNHLITYLGVQAERDSSEQKAAALAAELEEEQGKEEEGRERLEEAALREGRLSEKEEDLVQQLAVAVSGRVQEEATAIH